jgi:hypothetical protein
MTTPAAPAPRKLPVWRTAGACYVTVARNLGQLVRISWLWLLVMVPVYALTHWLALHYMETSQGPTMQVMARQLLGLLPYVIELPFLASIAVAWHQLVLRGERVSQLAYLRLDKAVWLYALYSFAFMALVQGPLTVFLGVAPDAELATSPRLSALIIVTVWIALFALPRLSLVLPAVALGERLSLGEAWSITQGNSRRLAVVTCLCLVPAGILLILPLLWFPFIPGASWEGLYEVLGSLWFVVSTSLTYAVLIIVAVTLLSLTYSFFVTPAGAGSPTPVP